MLCESISVNILESVEFFPLLEPRMYFPTCSTWSSQLLLAGVTCQTSQLILWLAVQRAWLPGRGLHSSKTFYAICHGRSSRNLSLSLLVSISSCVRAEMSEDRREIFLVSCFELLLLEVFPLTSWSPCLSHPASITVFRADSTSCFSYIVNHRLYVLFCRANSVNFG
jgi:hypothetical protein